MDELSETFFYQRERFVAWKRPKLFVEDFNFDQAVVSRSIDRRNQLAELDTPVSHQASAVQKIGRRYEPVAHVKCKDAAAGSINLAVNIWIPPHMVGINDDADCVRWEIVGQHSGLFQGGNDGSVGGEHWMQRLDSESDSPGLRVRSQGGDAFTNHLPAAVQPCWRNPPAYQNQ